jgi:hypothetical protein
MCLVWGAFVPSLASVESSFVSSYGSNQLLLAFVLLAMLFARAARTAEGRWLAALTLVSTIPLLTLYTSSRYLFTASFGFAGLVAVALEGRRFRRPLRCLALLLFGVYALRLNGQTSTIPRTLEEELQHGIVDTLGSVAATTSSQMILVLDFPHQWLYSQFLQETLECRLGRPLPKIAVLSVRRDPSAPPTQVETASDGFILSRSGAPLYQHDSLSDFPERPLSEGQDVVTSSYQVRVLGRLDSGVNRISVSIPEPWRNVTIVRFQSPLRVETLSPIPGQ